MNSPPSTDPAPAPWRAALPYVLVGGALLIVIALTGHEIERNFKHIESWLSNMGPMGIVVFVGLFTVAASFLVSEVVLCFMAGALFGWGWGIVAAAIAYMLASVLQYFLASRFLRAQIDRLANARPSMKAVKNLLHHDGLRMQLLLRLTPINPATLSYILGAAGVRLPGFILGCTVRLPSLVAEVYFGYAGRHLARMAGRNARDVYVHDLVMLVGVIVCIVAMILVARVAHKSIVRAMAEPDPDPLDDASS